MQPIDPDYLNQKAADLDLGRYQTIKLAQELLDQWYPGRARALSFNKGVLKVVTPSASVAGDLRLRQVELLNILQIEKLSIGIRPL
jgi:hypothetical protein